MKKIITVFLCALLASSCDDGDIIVTNFEFEGQSLQWCGNEDSQVFYKINNDGVNEAIALTLNVTRASENLLFEAEEEEFRFDISESNRVIYRTFSGEVGSDYFCNQIPPTNPTVAEEYHSTSGGQVVITSALRNTDDHDQDGVPSAVEMQVSAPQEADGYPDTDGDGIPDYLDVDDDNDNVLTQTEIEVTADQTADGYPDTDGDGTPDYLDTDDDGDGVITRYEDLNESLNPADDINENGIPLYLDPGFSDSVQIDQFRPNTFNRSFRYTVQVLNLTLVRQGGNGEQITLERYVLGSFDSPQVPYTPEDEDEDGDGTEDEGDGDQTGNQ